ncbi:MAG: glucose-6-phosphate isomerase [Hyphomicrobiaceae bacterium]
MSLPDAALTTLRSDDGRVLLTQRISGCLAARLGTRGLEAAVLAACLERLKAPLADLAASARTGRLEHFAILDRDDDIVAAEAALARLSDGAGTIVFLGTGGSSLGGQTLAQLNGWHIPGAADAVQKKRPRTRFYDNLDAATLQGALGSLDLARTRFVAISKSGGTAETLVQLVAALAAIRHAGLAKRIPELVLAVSDPAGAHGNGLRALCQSLAIPVLDHPPGIGGRYSALSVVGLLPAIARGLDVRAVRRGAKAVVTQLMAASDPAASAAAVGAAVAVALAETCGVRVNVMMPYADRLGRFGSWYVQLWAESLGKGGQGTTPLACLGPLDQHSQLQLFLDGAREHYLTIVRTATAGTGPSIEADLANLAGIGFMAGRPVGDLVAAQAEALPEALAEAGRPVRIIELPRLDEAALGALMMQMMIETILAARLMGVDPFDQPAVELAKRLTRARMGA